MRTEIWKWCQSYVIQIRFLGRCLLDHSPTLVPIMTLSNGHIFRVTGPLCGESAVDRWSPLTMASEVELWYFLMCTGTNGWTNSWVAGDLRRHDAHYVVSVISIDIPTSKTIVPFIHIKSIQTTHFEHWNMFEHILKRVKKSVAVEHLVRIFETLKSQCFVEKKGASCL